jgi:hypothetical protein
VLPIQTTHNMPLLSSREYCLNMAHTEVQKGPMIAGVYIHMLTNIYKISVIHNFVIYLKTSE